VANNLIEKDEFVSLNIIKVEHWGHTITKLLYTLEESNLTLARNYKMTTEIEIRESVIDKKTAILSLTSDSNTQSYSISHFDCIQYVLQILPVH
jgi:hypothetical protein